MKNICLSLCAIVEVMTVGSAFGCHGENTDRDTENRCETPGDCRKPYICDLGFCRAECQNDDDCPDGSCTKSPSDSRVKVCTKTIANSPDNCRNRSCPDDLICAVDDTCRRGCEDQDECGEGEVCFQRACFESTPPSNIDAGMIDDSSGNVCSGVECSGQGRCVDDHGIAECECVPGYKADLLECVTDPCYQIECVGKGACIDVGGTAACSCDPGYKTDRLSCIVDPCYQYECPVDSSCQDVNGRPICTCDPGFKSEGTWCVLDPCYMVTCVDHSTCTPNGLTSNCICDPGYRPDGWYCVTDPCYDVSCSGNGYCNENYGVAECICYWEYYAEGLDCVHNNRDPIAVDDSASTSVNVSATISVLDNDMDEDGDTLTIAELGQPQYGVAELSSDGRAIIYTPNQDFIGEDFLTYWASDGKGGYNDSAYVTVTITPAG
jgi:hypothetical protein